MAIVASSESHSPFHNSSVPGERGLSLIVTDIIRGAYLQEVEGEHEYMLITDIIRGAYLQQVEGVHEYMLITDIIGGAYLQ